MPRLTKTLLAATACLLLAPGAANAASVSFAGNVLTYTAAGSEENGLTVSLPDDGFCTARAHPCLLLEESPGVAIANAAGSDCSAREETYAIECRVPASLVVNLGAGNDALYDWDGPTVADGGIGDDTLDGAGGDDLLRGAAGVDTLFGGEGDDRLEGGDGDDRFEGYGIENGSDGAGTDSYYGGLGRDLVDYSGRSENLTLSPGGAADDGAPGEGDLIDANVEQIFGGSGNDTITGNAQDNRLEGSFGNDVIRGGTGDDELNGREGDDQLFGEDGADVIRSEGGADLLDGGRGVDVFNALGAGGDRIEARDGNREQVTCGSGSDTAILDATDELVLDSGDSRCDRVERDGPTDPPKPPITGDTVAPQLAGLGAKAQRGRKLAIRYRLSEPAKVTFRLQRKSRGRWKSLRGSFSQAGRLGANTARFNGRLAGKRVKPGRYRLLVTARDAAGNRGAAKRLLVRVRR